MRNYLVATLKPWNIEAYRSYSTKLPGTWKLISEKEELSEKLIAKFKPRYIFFPHWSWIVPEWVLKASECVCFHMTDVPYGRGGTPLQNLIVRGHKETKLSALRMVSELDAGPVYLKRPLSLVGSASEIFTRQAKLTAELIAEIVEHEPEPKPQEGEVVQFERRTPEQSLLPDSFAQLYDHIRMLDAKTYPKAFLEHGDYRLEFSQAHECAGVLEAKVSIRRKDE